MNPAIFREYDIRGLAEKDLNREFALLLGKAHGTIIRENGGSRVAVGRDCRSTSDAYAEAVIAGLASTGLHVYDIGVCPTPLLYFSLFHLDLDGAPGLARRTADLSHRVFEALRHHDLRA